MRKIGCQAQTFSECQDLTHQMREHVSPRDRRRCSAPLARSRDVTRDSIAHVVTLIHARRKEVCRSHARDTVGRYSVPPFHTRTCLMTSPRESWSTTSMPARTWPNTV